jgi:site-specific DNA-methyltransferase (adenine-specific)
VVGLFPDQTSGANPTSRGGIGYMSSAKGQASCDAPRGIDSGSAARFFYVAKASAEDRDDGCSALPAKSAGEVTGGRAEGSAGLDSPRSGAGRRREETRNIHPTVKPTDLMRYLCRLVTPPGGLVLDPFVGSGSTGRGAVLEGFRFVGIEREAEYVAIARARIDAAIRQRRSDTAQGSLF